VSLTERLAGLAVSAYPALRAAKNIAQMMSTMHECVSLNLARIHLAAARSSGFGVADDFETDLTCVQRANTQPTLIMRYVVHTFRSIRGEATLAAALAGFEALDGAIAVACWQAVPVLSWPAA
jgi:hypothetical protein